MHRYNNQDHSMLTAMLAAGNILGSALRSLAGERRRGVSRSRPFVSTDELQAMERTQPAVPARVSSD